MELGFFIVLGGLFLIFLFVASFVASFKKVSSRDLAGEYLKVGLRELKARIEEELRIVEGRESELKERLRHLEALERVVSERLEDPVNRCLLLRGDLKDAV
jgi:hypothetical protein